MPIELKNEEKLCVYNARADLEQAISELNETLKNGWEFGVDNSIFHASKAVKELEKFRK